MLKIYLAGAIRDKYDYIWREAFTRHYKGQVTCLSPSDIGIADVNKLRTFSGSSYLTYRSDLALIDQVDALVVNLLPMEGGYASTGTVFEIGYARARNKLVLILAGPKLRQHPFIAFGGDGVFPTWQRLCEYLEQYLVVQGGHSPVFDDLASDPIRVGGCAK